MCTASGVEPAGVRRAVWKHAVPAGVYIVRLVTGGAARVQTIVKVE
ncbi:MAG: T9SS type A sorting domain-containing protein [Rhodothermales bacterium]